MNLTSFFFSKPIAINEITKGLNIDSPDKRSIFEPFIFLLFSYLTFFLNVHLNVFFFILF